MLQAAAEVTQRGLAHITLLGDPETVRAEAEKMGIDLSLVDVVSPVVRGQGLGFRRTGEGGGEEYTLHTWTPS